MHDTGMDLPRGVEEGHARCILLQCDFEWE